MCKPLKDIISELEAKCEGIKLLYDLNERRRIIATFDHDIDYMFRRIDMYEEDVKFVLRNGLNVQIIGRMTINLILVIEHILHSFWDYQYVISSYLMDDQYEKHHDLWSKSIDTHDKIEKLINNSQENNVFEVETPDRVKVLKRIFRGKDRGIEKMGELEISHEVLLGMNGAELHIIIEFQLSLIVSMLGGLKNLSLYRKDEMLETSYDINFLLYAREYWPKEEHNFRQHILRQRLRGNISIEKLEELRDEAMHDFEYNTVPGKIWRDYSEDKKEMAYQMKEQKLDEEQWKFFFSWTFKFAEYDTWIEELRNPPESDEDKVKRDLLLRSNSIFDTQKMQEKGIDILKLYNFVKVHFIKDDMKSYLWYALRRFLEKLDILLECTNVDFEKQINNSEWFKSAPKPCSDNEMNNYNFLNGKHSSLWLSTDIPEGSRATQYGLRNVYNVYSGLELNEKELME